MKKQSRRVETLKTLIKEESYSLKEGVKLLKELGTAKFTESVEAHISLAIDPKYANQQLRTSLVLPNGTGKSIRIAVLTEPDNVDDVLKMGVDVVGSDDLLEEISNGNLNFDLLITTPQLMPKLAKLGRALGPKGLMPSPKSGTVTTNLKETIDEFNNSLIKRNKKQNLTPTLCFLGQLCQIPGISIIKAKPIVEKYENIANLIMAYESSGLTEDEKKLFLSNIVYSTNNEKIRKIGKKASITIYEYLF